MTPAVVALALIGVVTVAAVRGYHRGFTAGEEYGRIMADIEHRTESRADGVLPDGCVGGHSPSLVSCELGAEWP